MDAPGESLKGYAAAGTDDVAIKLMGRNGYGLMMAVVFKKGYHGIFRWLLI